MPYENEKSAWPTLTRKVCCAGNPRASSYPMTTIETLSYPLVVCRIEYEPYIESPSPRAHSRI